MIPLEDLRRALGLLESELEPRGRYVGKVALSVLERLRDAPRGKLVLVTALTPLARGEGKTTTAIGLTDALRRSGSRAIATLRQPTLGPVFGKKGGGAGGGKSQVVPHDLVDLHLTGDSHAVQAAHNLAASFIDNHIHHGNALAIEPATISFPRVLDLEDRALRKIVLGLGGASNGPVRESSFEITSASEVMAILALASDRRDLRERLGRIVVASSKTGEPITLEQLHVAGAMAALLHDAIEPNLVQTLEGSPALVHAGPFANIAHGCCSVVADRVALALADHVITEAGFGADLGAEKFFDLKARASGLEASAAVLVATVHALMAHGGAHEGERDLAALERGAGNLAANVAIVREFGVPCLVAINSSKEDTPAELEAALACARACGARAAFVVRPFDEGGPGCLELAGAVVETCREPSRQRLLYADDLSLEAKIEIVAQRIYGASGVDLAPSAHHALAALEARGHGRLPVCIAKTPASLSHDPKLVGRPRGFRLPVHDVRLAAGAGFVVVLAGEISLMPGLPTHPAGELVDLDAKGEIIGLR